MRPIHILRLRDANKIGGPEKTILDTARAIDQTRFRFTLASFCEGRNEFLDAAKQKGISTLPIGMSRPLEMRSIIYLKNYFKQNCVDIFHAHDYKSRFIGYWAAKLAKVTTVTTVHGWIQNTLKDKAYVALDKLMLRLYPKIIVVSKDLRNKVLKLGIPSDRILLLYNAVPEPHPKGISDNLLRKELGIGNNEKIFASIGRLSKEKGLDDFVLSASMVLQKFQDMRFVIVGDGPERSHLEQLSSRYNISPFFSFMGFRFDMDTIYWGLDAVVLSSYTEGLPKVILEALSYGKPVIATEVGGVPEIIRQDETGLLIPPGSPALLAEAMCNILDHPSKRDSLGKAGKELVEKEFSIKARTRKLEHLYELIAEDSKRR